MAWWAQLRDWLEGRALRERVLIFLALAAIVGVLGFEGFIAPALEEQRQLERRTESARKEIQGLQKQIAELSDRSFDERKADLRRQAAGLKDRIGARREALGEKAGRFIRPRRLMAFFEDLLLAPGSGPMEVVRVESKEREALDLGGASGSNGDGVRAALFRKGVKVRLRGTYPGFLDFLDRIEALDWAVQVTGLDYRVLEYPRAEVSVTLHTFLFESRAASGEA